MSSPLFFGLVPLSPSDLWSWAAWFCLLFVLVKGWRLYLKWKQLVKAFSPFEGPKCHWLFDNAQEFLQNGNDMQIMIRFAEQYLYVFPLWLGNFFAVLTICHPNYAKAILSRQEIGKSYYQRQPSEAFPSCQPHDTGHHHEMCL
ncbi:cytochrome P450 4B1-like isoform X3 [Dendrobates tinctorius]|uniref:cytochrome P450 4B1-like isoform X3 n=1 Tax=Dendrobates tinctorius TaxID=92724 RepID=UPI003CC99A43